MSHVAFRSQVFLSRFIFRFRSLVRISHSDVSFRSQFQIAKSNLKFKSQVQVSSSVLKFTSQIQTLGKQSLLGHFLPHPAHPPYPIKYTSLCKCAVCVMVLSVCWSSDFQKMSASRKPYNSFLNPFKNPSKSGFGSLGQHFEQISRKRRLAQNLTIPC